VESYVTCSNRSLVYQDVQDHYTQKPSSQNSHGATTLRAQFDAIAHELATELNRKSASEPISKLAPSKFELLLENLNPHLHSARQPRSYMSSRAYRAWCLPGSHTAWLYMCAKIECIDECHVASSVGGGSAVLAGLVRPSKCFITAAAGGRCHRK
jgi:hypothetical protein